MDSRADQKVIGMDSLTIRYDYSNSGVRKDKHQIPKTKLY